MRRVRESIAGIRATLIGAMMATQRQMAGIALKTPPSNGRGADSFLGGLVLDMVVDSAFSSLIGGTLPALLSVFSQSKPGSFEGLVEVYESEMPSHKAFDEAQYIRGLRIYEAEQAQYRKLEGWLAYLERQLEMLDGFEDSIAQRPGVKEQKPSPIAIFREVAMGQKHKRQKRIKPSLVFA